MLGLVELTTLDAGDRDPEAVDADADLQEAVGSVPLHELRADNAGIG